MKFMNEANWDRALRIILGLALLYLGWTGTAGGTLGWIFKVGGLIPVVTGIAGWCALYAVLGISTRDRAPGAA
jgi:hypothetical protein